MPARDYWTTAGPFYEGSDRGNSGLRNQPGAKGGDMWFTLPDGGELLFKYEPRPLGLRCAGYVRVILYGATPLTGSQLSASVETAQ